LRWQVEPLRGATLARFNSRWETDAFLKQAGAHLDYTEADLEHDIDISQQIK